MISGTICQEKKREKGVFFCIFVNSVPGRLKSMCMWNIQEAVREAHLESSGEEQGWRIRAGGHGHRGGKESHGN